MDINSICKDCHRDSFCEAPCQAYLDEFDRVHHEIQNSKTANPLKSMVSEDAKPHESGISKGLDNDITRFLNFSVENDEWLKAIEDKNFLHDEMIDIGSILNFLDSENEKYCVENGLCEFCRSKFVEIKEPMGEQFGTPVYIDALYCPKCG